jgi:peptide/nickel transport system substrate-binding protein
LTQSQEDVVKNPSRRTVTTALFGGTALAVATGCSDRSSGASEGGGEASGGSTKTDLIVAAATLATTYAGPDGGNGASYENYELNVNTQAMLIRNPYVEGRTPDVLVQDYYEYEGYLAEEFSWSDDGRTLTVTLAEGVTSPNGNTLSADDVIWSFERKYASTASPIKAMCQPFFTDPATQLVKVDDRTVTFSITEPGYGQEFLGILGNALAGGIHDSTFLRTVATPEDPYAIEWSKTGTGWGFGAYNVASVTPDQEMVLTANENYVLGAPSITKVVLRSVPDPGTRASLLLSGDVDLAENIRPADQADLAESEGVVVPDVESIEYVDLTLVTNKAPFDDQLVRQAMAWAIPYEQIMEQIYSGRADRIVGNINPQTPGYSTDGLPTYDYDVDKAKQLLAQAGFPDGLTFTLAVSNALPDMVDSAVLIQSYAKDAGITIEIQQDTPAAFAQARSGATYQALLYRNRAQVQSPTYSSTLFWRPGNNTSNPSRWEDPAFYAAVQAASAVADPLSEEAGALWEAATTIQLNGAAEIFVCTVQPAQVYRDTVSGYAYRTENAVDFANVEVSA